MGSWISGRTWDLKPWGLEISHSFRLRYCMDMDMSMGMDMGMNRLFSDPFIVHVPSYSYHIIHTMHYWVTMEDRVRIYNSSKELVGLPCQHSLSKEFLKRAEFVQRACPKSLSRELVKIAYLNTLSNYLVKIACPKSLSQHLVSIAYHHAPQLSRGSGVEGRPQGTVEN